VAVEERAHERSATPDRASEQTSESATTVWFAIAANASIFVAKAVGGLVTGSSALLAEAAHSFADTCNQGLMLLSLSRSERPPDEEHPFGYGKERFFWALLAAIFIFVAGGIFSIAEGVFRFVVSSGEQGHFLVAYAVLGIALVAESISLARAVRQTSAEAREAELPFAEYIATSKEPAAKTVFAEDGVAVLGVVIAFVGTALGQVTGERIWDSSAAVLIGLLLCLVAWLLGQNAKDLLIGAPARPEERERIRQEILAHDGVEGVVELLTMYTGPHSLLVAARIDLENELSGDEVERLSNDIDADLRDALPDVSEVFLDATARGERSRRAV
jgi:cation diffusion facilitator family transporter